MGVEEPLGLGRRKPFDAERGREGHERLVEPVEMDERRACHGLLGFDPAGRLAVELQPPRTALATQARRGGASGEHAEQGVGPQVLMYVHAPHGP